METVFPQQQAAVLKNVIQFNSSLAGRDKVFKFFQSLSNLILWSRDSTLHPDHRQRLQHLATSLSLCRQLLRFGNFLNSLDGALKALLLDDTFLRLSLSISKLNASVQTLIENLLFLHRLGFLPLSATAAKSLERTRDKLWLVSRALALLRDFYEISSIAVCEAKRVRVGSASRKLRRVERGGAEDPTDNDPDTSSKKGEIFFSVTDESRDMFRPSLSPTSLKNLDWTKFLIFLWRHHFPLCLDTIKNGSDLVAPLKNAGLLPDANIGVLSLCSLTSSVCGMFSVWNPIYRLTPS